MSAPREGAPSAASSADPNALARASSQRFLARLVWGPLALGALAVVGTARRLRPDGRRFGTHEQLGLPPCMFTETTGVPCPGCGLTTSFAHMAHLQPLEAFRAHLMGPLLFCLTLWLGVYGLYAFAKARSPAVLLDSPLAVPALGLTSLAGLAHFGLRLAHVLPAP